MFRKEKSSRYADVIRVFRMVHGFSGMLTLSVVIRAANKLSTISLAVAIALFIEQTVTHTVDSLVWWIGIMGLILLATIALSYFDTYVSHDISFKIIKILRDKMYDHMDKIAPGGLDGRNSADSATIILSDIEVFEWFFAHCLVEWLGTFVSLLVCMFLLCRISIAAAIAVIFTLVLMMVVPFFSMEQAKQKGLLMKHLYGALNGIVSDGVSGSKDIIGFHWTKAFFAKLDQTSETYSKAQGQFAKRSEWERTLEAVVACIAVLTGLLLASAELAGGELTHLIPIFALLMSAVGCIQESLSEGTNFGFVFGAAGRMVSVLDVKAPVEDTGTKTRSDISNEDGTWELVLKDAAFQYAGGQSLLKGVSFEAHSSETIAVVAASGGGKSTIAKLLQRFWDVTTGGIYINGTDIRDLTLDRLYVFYSLTWQYGGDDGVAHTEYVLRRRRRRNSKCCDRRLYDECGPQGHDGAHEWIERRHHGSIDACGFVPLLRDGVEIERCSVVPFVWPLYDYFLRWHGVNAQIGSSGHLRLTYCATPEKLACQQKKSFM